MKICQRNDAEKLNRALKIFFAVADSSQNGANNTDLGKEINWGTNHVYFNWKLENAAAFWKLCETKLKGKSKEQSSAKVQLLTLLGPLLSTEVHTLLCPLFS